MRPRYTGEDVLELIGLALVAWTALILLTHITFWILT